IHIYEMKDEFLERRFTQGDEIQVPLNNKKYTLQLVAVDDKLTLRIPSGEVLLSLGEERLLDLDEDSKEDIKVFVRDIDLQDQEKGVIARFDKFTQSTISATNRTGEEVPTGDLSPGATEPPEEARTVSVSKKTETIDILKTDQAHPYSVDIIFRSYCFLRYLADESFREERYFHKGETFRLDVNKEVRLWVSNAGSFKARIAGREIDMGRPGEVATKLIKWVKDDQSGQFKLQLIQMY
ncbi:MAG: hypothetical protein AB1798_24465, partial [Spirochaetota bacterium]